MQNTLAPVQFEIADILKKRKSIRAYDIHKPVLRNDILSLLEAARWSPNCFNDEPWRFMVWDINSNPEAHLKAFECLGEWNQKWVKTAPVLMASFAAKKFREGGKDNKYAQHDTGAATNSICIQAASMGLQAHPMAGFSAEKLVSEFQIPEEFTPMAMIAVGYPGELQVLEQSFHEGETKERFRRPLGSTMFMDTWEYPII